MDTNIISVGSYAYRARQKWQLFWAISKQYPLLIYVFHISICATTYRPAMCFPLPQVHRKPELLTFLLPKSISV
jgi:hypothetical protein